MIQKPKYKSKYGATRDLSAGQYLSEYILERIAKKEKTTLPYKFWEIDKWKKEFVKQTILAARLLEELTVEEVFEVLKSKKGQKIYSLGCYKTLIKPIAEEMRRKKIQCKTVMGQELDLNNMGIYKDIEQVPEEDILVVDDGPDHLPEEPPEVPMKKSLWEEL